MRDIDQGMTPSGHFNQAVRAGRRVVFGVAVMPKAERAGFVLRHMPHFGHFLERLRQLRRIIDIQANLLPFFRHHAPLHQRLWLQPRFNRQQAKARRYVGVITQLGRAHGGTAGAGGHDSAPITGKENGIDQLGLSA